MKLIIENERFHSSLTLILRLKYKVKISETKRIFNQQATFFENCTGNFQSFKFL